MITKDLYKRLESIFVEYTTHQWKNVLYGAIREIKLNKLL